MFKQSKKEGKRFKKEGKTKQQTNVSSSGHFQIKLKHEENIFILHTLGLSHCSLS